MPGGMSVTSDDPVSAQVDVARLDSYDIADLLPTTEEVHQRLGWTDDVNFEAPDFSALPVDGDAAVAAFGGPIAIGVVCADVIKELGVVPGAPIGAIDVAANMWAERNVTVREIWLARYPSAEAASGQVEEIPAVIEACPSVNFARGRTVAVIPSSLHGSVAFQASDSYSWVVASFGNLLVQVQVGISDAEVASGEALIQLQLDKLQLITRGEYE